jgi:hypothetical protein
LVSSTDWSRAAGRLKPGLMGVTRSPGKRLRQTGSVSAGFAAGDVFEAQSIQTFATLWLLFEGRNPPAGVLLDYALAKKAGKVSLKVVDVTGSPVTELRATGDEGPADERGEPFPT